MNHKQLNHAASVQHGAFSLRQAREAGFDRSAVYGRIRSGAWLRIDDSVYALASAPATWRQRLWACVLSRPNAVLTHFTACRLHGLDDVPTVDPAILVPRTSNTRSKFARVYETDQFDRIAVTYIDGLPVTTMPETLLVLARDTTATIIEGLFDASILIGKLDLKAMAGTIDREAGRRTPGAPLLRRLTSSRLPSAPTRAASYLEAVLETMLHDPRMPRWTREHEFSLGGMPARVDVYVPSVALVIEADGRNWHGRWADMEKDRRRDVALAAGGVQVLRFTYAMLSDEPGRCLEQIIEVCRIRAAYRRSERDVV